MKGTHFLAMGNILKVGTGRTTEGRRKIEMLYWSKIHFLFPDMSITSWKRKKRSARNKRNLTIGIGVCRRINVDVYQCY